MKVVSQDALTKLIQLSKDNFIDKNDTVQATTVPLATVALSGNASDLINDVGYITQDINVNATELQYTVSSSNQQVSSVTTYTSQTSPLSARQRAVCYGNGYWVTAGASGSMAYSTNGTSWTSVTPFCSGTITGITYGNGYFLCVEYESNKVWKADLPSGSWTTIYTAESALESIQYINNTFVITGESGLIAISETGEVWDAKTTGISANIIKATYGNGMYVAVGASGAIITSVNGITWTPRMSGISTDIRTVAYGNGRFVCGGKEILYSTDGITWVSASSLPESVSGWIREFAYGEKRYYCSVYTSGGLGQIWYSTDCSTWTKALNLTSSNSRLWTMCFGNGVFLSSGDSGLIYTLNLGNTWTTDIPTTNGQYIWCRNVIIQNNGSKVYSDAFILPSGDSLPSQSGQSGKFLTTNGTTASWGDALTNTGSHANSLAIGKSSLSTWTGDIIITTADSIFSGASCGGAIIVGRNSSYTSTSFSSLGVGDSCSVAGQYAIALGGNSHSSANYAIQLGQGTNSEANSFYVGTSSLNNWKLLGSDGKIPDDRLNTPIPSQTGQSGKFLTTNGTSVSWAESTSTTVTYWTDD